MKEKIKVVFCLPVMLARGVEKSFLTLLKFLPQDKYDITLVLVEEKGEFLDLIPSYVHIKNVKAPTSRRHDIVSGLDKKILFEYFRTGNFKASLIAAVNLILKKLLNTGYDTSLFQVKELEGKYDLAICYHIHCPFLIFYTREKIRANKYYAWMHNDFEASGFKVRGLKNELEKYDHIFGVSQKVVDEFNEQLPDLESKTSLFSNVIDKQDILQKSTEFYPEEFEGIECIKIASVGSIEYQKGFDCAIEVASKLREEGYKFKWVIVGDGTEKGKLENKIQENHLENMISFCGVKKNPYPYMNYCDIYVQPSRHEGFCLTSSEAKILGKPIVTTNYSGVSEKFDNHINASVVDFDSECIKNAIAELMRNEALRKKYKNNIQKENITRSNDINNYFDRALFN